MGVDYYTILEVDNNAKDEDLKKAFIELSMQFKQISEAYEVLSDPQKRAVYDQFGKEGLKGQVPPPAAAGGRPTFSRTGGGPNAFRNYPRTAGGPGGPRPMSSGPRKAPLIFLLCFVCFLLLGGSRFSGGSMFGNDNFSSFRPMSSGLRKAPPNFLSCFVCFISAMTFFDLLGSLLKKLRDGLRFSGGSMFGDDNFSSFRPMSSGLRKKAPLIFLLCFVLLRVFSFMDLTKKHPAMTFLALLGSLLKKLRDGSRFSGGSMFGDDNFSSFRPMSSGLRKKAPLIFFIVFGFVFCLFS